MPGRAPASSARVRTRAVPAALIWWRSRRLAWLEVCQGNPDTVLDIGHWIAEERFEFWLATQHPEGLGPIAGARFLGAHSRALPTGSGWGGWR